MATSWSGWEDWTGLCVLTTQERPSPSPFLGRSEYHVSFHVPVDWAATYFIGIQLCFPLEGIIKILVIFKNKMTNHYGTFTCQTLK